MKNLKQLYEENGNKGGFWVHRLDSNKEIFFVHGKSQFNNDDFVIESEHILKDENGDYSYILHTPPKPKTKVIAYVSLDNSDVPMFIVGGAEIERTGYARAKWLDGEIE